jgi:hypothetical protein
VPVLHFVEFLVEEVEAGRISPAAMKVDAAGYHDPCHLGRKLGVFDEPRRLVRLATGWPLLNCSTVGRLPSAAVPVALCSLPNPKLLSSGPPTY